jgi:hypothetical protein
MGRNYKPMRDPDEAGNDQLKWLYNSLEVRHG